MNSDYDSIVQSLNERVGKLTSTTASGVLVTQTSSTMRKLRIPIFVTLVPVVILVVFLLWNPSCLRVKYELSVEGGYPEVRSRRCPKRILAATLTTAGVVMVVVIVIRIRRNSSSPAGPNKSA